MLISQYTNSSSKSIRKIPNDPIVIRSADRPGDCPAKEIKTALNEKIFRVTHNKINTATPAPRYYFYLSDQQG